MSTTKQAVRGQVSEVLPNDLYRVQFGEGREVLAHRAGKMRLHKISLYVGDEVMVVLDPYGGKTTNRIIQRM